MPTHQPQKPRRLFAIILTAFLAGLSIPASASTAPDNQPQASAERKLIRGTVSRISDGDTLTLKPDSGEKAITVRMVGIDTPELHLPSHGQYLSQGHWAETAAKRLAALAPIGARVTLESWGAQSYGRSIGRIFNAKGEDINLKLVQEGWAAAYVICGGASCKSGFIEQQDVRAYMRACDEAVRGELGIYDPRDPLPEQPFEFRARIGEKEPFRRVGDLKTGRLYSPERYPEVPLCRRIFFDSREAAARMGYHSEE